MCKQEKNDGDFHKDRNRVDGLYPYCKTCRNTIETPKYRKKHKQDKIDYQTRYRARKPATMLWYAAKYRARRKGLEFDLELNDIKIPSVCPVLGIPIFIQVGKGKYPNAPSIDRIDPKKGYTKNNIIIVSWRANDIKGNASVDELKKVIEFYEKSLIRH